MEFSKDEQVRSVLPACLHVQCQRCLVLTWAVLVLTWSVLVLAVQGLWGGVDFGVNDSAKVNTAASSAERVVRCLALTERALAGHGSG
eukprot:440594-Rhodomonas_salina.3